MKETLLVFLVPVLVVASILTMAFCFGYAIKRYEDNYCINTPIDRLNRSRCGLEK